MAVYVSMLRGVNVGGHKLLKMSALCELFQSLELQTPRSYVQSGNVLFQSREKNPLRLADRIENAIEQAYGFRPAVIIRTIPQLREVLTKNPFRNRPDVLPAKLLITFLATEPDPEARTKVLQIKTDGEEIRILGREMYVHYPNSAGRSKIQLSRLEKESKTTGTARNLNTVEKLLELAEQMEAAGDT